MPNPREQQTDLYVATAAGDPIYHAAWATQRNVARSEFVRSLCRKDVRPTPRAWDESRQQRTDSCHRCARRARQILDEQRRSERGRDGPLIAGYIRASTDRQVASPDIQQATIIEHARRLGLDEPRFYIDPATSGKTSIFEREAGRRMLRDLDRGDHVIVARLDRLSRNFVDFASTMDTWCRMGVTFHPCDFPMSIRPDDHLTLMFVSMLSLFAGYERKLIASRTREAHQALIAQGRVRAAHCRFGYRREYRNGHWYEVPDETEAKIAVKALDLAIQGYTYQQISDYLWEAGVRNPRAFYNSHGRVMKDCGRIDPETKGRFHAKHLGILIDRGIELAEFVGYKLPENFSKRRHLMRDRHP